MSAQPQNGVTELAYMIPEVWSSTAYKQLRNSLILAAFFEKTYEGDAKNKGDIVRVNQVVAPTGEILTNDKQKFKAEDLSISQFTLEIDKRASASFIITDLAKLQSMEFMQEVVDALVYSIKLQLEGDILALCLAAAGAGTAIAAASDYAAVDAIKARTVLSKLKVPIEGRGLFLDCDFYGDLLGKNQIISSDFVSGQPLMDQKIPQIAGAPVIEHNLFTADTALLAHKSALQLAMQQDLRIKISDRHVINEYGFLVSADFVYGAKVFDANRLYRQKAS